MDLRSMDPLRGSGSCTGSIKIGTGSMDSFHPKNTIVNNIKIEIK